MILISKKWEKGLGSRYRGGSSGGGGLGGQAPHPFWGTSKLHKEGKKRSPPPFRNPVSAPEVPKRGTFGCTHNVSFFLFVKLLATGPQDLPKTAHVYYFNLRCCLCYAGGWIPT